MKAKLDAWGRILLTPEDETEKNFIQYWEHHYHNITVKPFFDFDEKTVCFRLDEKQADRSISTEDSNSYAKQLGLKQNA